MSRSTHADHLTPGDWEVLPLVAAGLSKPQMSEKLSLSYDTVKDHGTNIRLFLQAQTESDLGTPGALAVFAAAWLRENGGNTPDRG